MFGNILGNKVVVQSLSVVELGILLEPVDCFPVCPRILVGNVLSVLYCNEKPLGHMHAHGVPKKFEGVFAFVWPGKLMETEALKTCGFCKGQSSASGAEPMSVLCGERERGNDGSWFGFRQVGA